MKKLIPFCSAGCFKLPQDLADPNTEVIPFDNDFVTVDDAVIQRFDLTLKCPDGEPASFHLVYRSGSDEPAGRSFSSTPARSTTFCSPEGRP